MYIHSGNREWLSSIHSPPHAAPCYCALFFFFSNSAWCARARVLYAALTGASRGGGKGEAKDEMRQLKLFLSQKPICHLE